MFITLAQSRFEHAPDLSSLRLCILASALFPTNTPRIFQNLRLEAVRQLYGSTKRNDEPTGLTTSAINSRSGWRALPQVSVCGL